MGYNLYYFDMVLMTNNRMIVSTIVVKEMYGHKIYESNYERVFLIKFVFSFMIRETCKMY